MRWILCLITLSTFLTQQVVCCCATEFSCASGGCDGHDHHGDDQSQATPKFADCQHAAHQTGRQAVKCGGHSVPTDLQPESDVPSDDGPNPHSHHLCVGTHVFYRTVSATTVPDPWIFAAAGLSSLSGEAVLSSTATLERGSCWVLKENPPRSLLGVFLI